MAQFTLVNGSVVCVTVLVPNYGQMAPGMKDNGVTIKRMVRANLCMQMAMCMRESGLMTKRRVKELIRMQMAPTMKASG
jgi:hypothetical protein